MLVQVAAVVRGFVWYTLLRLLSGFSNENAQASVAGISVSVCVCVCLCQYGLCPCLCSALVSELQFYCLLLTLHSFGTGAASASFKVDQT